MYLKLATAASEKDQVIPLLPISATPGSFHFFYGQKLPDLSVGSKLFKSGKPHFVVAGKFWLSGAALACQAVLLQALTQIEKAPASEYTFAKDCFAVACITLSDKGYAGLRNDESGPLMAKLLSETLSISFMQNYILADEANALRGLMADLALNQGYDLICTSGGTGLGPRDITPQVTESLLDLHLPGFVQAMMAASLAKTARGCISRAQAGIIGKCMVINLPGSARAVEENLSVLLPAIDHALKKLKGDQSDCGV